MSTERVIPVEVARAYGREAMERINRAPAPSLAEEHEIGRFGMFDDEIRIRFEVGAALAAFGDMDRDEADEYAQILLPTICRLVDEMRVR